MYFAGHPGFGLVKISWEGTHRRPFGLVINSPTNGTGKLCVELRHYFLIKTSFADLLKVFCFVF